MSDIILIGFPNGSHWLMSHFFPSCRTLKHHALDLYLAGLF